MKRVFADSYYFLALLNEHDTGHPAAREFSRSAVIHLITTEWILVEVFDALAQPNRKDRPIRLLRALKANPDTTIVPATAEWFEAGHLLYIQRPDKAWSLTDCISFEVMRALGLTEALTGDRDFEQAGFARLLP